ncbi:MAG: AMIN domain-containing protein [Sulfurospirillum sp.]|nr:AMIN domain-containing protein [Sulfurospirillum sp.]
MRYVLVILPLLIVVVFARENPFIMPSVSTVTVKTTDKRDSREDFSSVKIKLPSSARVLKNIEFHFQNLDGSMESKSIKVDNKIDWHDELIVKKFTDTAKPATKPATKQIQKPLKPKEKVEKIYFQNFIVFTIDGKSIHVKTKDEKIRDFLVINPFKIVIDFKKELSFYTKVYKLERKFFKSISIGKHSGYYRVAIELDGRYLYSAEKVEDGYLFKLK